MTGLQKTQKPATHDRRKADPAHQHGEKTGYAYRYVGSEYPHLQPERAGARLNCNLAIRDWQQPLAVGWAVDGSGQVYVSQAEGYVWGMWPSPSQRQTGMELTAVEDDDGYRESWQAQGTVLCAAR